MSDEMTLLPCPFCGSEAHMSASSDGYGVECWNRRCIDMQMEQIPTEAEAITAWNTRTTLGSDVSTARLAERLHGIADEMRSVGASSMTPHMLLACYANEVSKVADSLVFATALRSGTLTAEQVMKIAGKHQPDYCSDTHVCFDWQAIADELNATVGNGTCHMDFIDEYERPSGDEDYLCECSECGSQMWEPAHDLPLYCRKCGKKVER